MLVSEATPVPVVACPNKQTSRAQLPKRGTASEQMWLLSPTAAVAVLCRSVAVLCRAVLCCAVLCWMTSGLRLADERMSQWVIQSARRLDEMNDRRRELSTN